MPFRVIERNTGLAYSPRMKVCIEKLLPAQGYAPERWECVYAFDPDDAPKLHAELLKYLANKGRNANNANKA